MVILESTSGGVLNTLRPHPETRLHRQLVENRNCQMAGGKLTTLQPGETALVERVEKILSRQP
ncbi:hypothetical protein [Arthrobacter sp. A5]|uniref:hypothetical protein n=1 Tax=Arthrobacter sp. A5 TaxID=576926 RepID=UPI003DA83124